MAAVASYLQRPNAALHAVACERYGVDPAGGLTDDFLAAQLRVGALVLASRVEEAASEAEPDPFEEARIAGARAKAMG